MAVFVESCMELLSFCFFPVLFLMLSNVQYAPHIKKRIVCPRGLIRIYLRSCHFGVENPNMTLYAKTQSKREFKILK